MMDLESAIRHCEEVMMENLEKTKGRNASDPIAINCFECADEHRQLAEWLRELKAYKEQSGDAISRQAVLDAMYDLCGTGETLKENPWRDNPHIDAIIDAIDDLPSVTPQQRTGRWIPVSERLPEDHDWYVIIVKEKSTGYQYIPRIASHNHDNCWSIIDTEDADKEWLDDLECIAWMPLPEPYKGESEE